MSVSLPSESGRNTAVSSSGRPSRVIILRPHTTSSQSGWSLWGLRDERGTDRGDSLTPTLFDITHSTPLPVSRRDRGSVGHPRTEDLSTRHMSPEVDTDPMCVSTPVVLLEDLTSLSLKEKNRFLRSSLSEDNFIFRPQQ